MYCPNCGQKIPAPAGDWLPIRTFESAAPLLPGQTSPGQAIPTFSVAYRKTPWRKPEFIPDVFVPLTQAIISGVLLAIVISVIAIFVKSWPSYLGLLVFPIVVGLGWCISMLNDRGLWIIEKITGRDIDQDNEPKKRIIEIEVKDGHTRHIAELPGNEEYLTKFCRLVTAGDSFSEATAQRCGYGVTNFRELRDIFINRRWGFWKNPDHRQGIELTVSGKQIIRSIASTPPPAAADAQIITR